MHVKKNDKVTVISGKDAGKTGRVLVALPKEGKIIVEGANMITRHVKPRNNQQQGGRVEQEGTIYASKVMIVCDKCKRPVRIRHKMLENGEKIRVCARCGESLE